MPVNVDSVRKLIRDLPARRRWNVNGTPLVHTFRVGRDRPAPLEPTVFDFPLERPWLDLIVFGEYDYSGGANPFLGVRKKDGAVLGLDVERDKPLFALNSGLEEFVKIFETLDAYLAKGRALPDDIHARLRKIDPKTYAKSDWRKFVQFALAEQEG